MMAATRSALARSRVRDMAMRIPSDDTATASQTPAPWSTKLVSSQLKFWTSWLGASVISGGPLWAGRRGGVGGRIFRWACSQVGKHPVDLVGALVARRDVVVAPATQLEVVPSVADAGAPDPAWQATSRGWVVARRLRHHASIGGSERRPLDRGRCGRVVERRRPGPFGYDHARTGSRRDGPVTIAGGSGDRLDGSGGRRDGRR